MSFGSGRTSGREGTVNALEVAPGDGASCRAGAGEGLVDDERTCAINLIAKVDEAQWLSILMEAYWHLNTVVSSFAKLQSTDANAMLRQIIRAQENS